MKVYVAINKGKVIAFSDKKKRVENLIKELKDCGYVSKDIKIIEMTEEERRNYMRKYLDNL